MENLFLMDKIVAIDDKCYRSFRNVAKERKMIMRNINKLSVRVAIYGACALILFAAIDERLDHIEKRLEEVENEH